MCYLPTPQKGGPHLPWCCLSCCWLCRSVVCVQRGVLPLCGPLCLFCSLSCNFWHSYASCVQLCVAPPAPACSGPIAHTLLCVKCFYIVSIVCSLCSPSKRSGRAAALSTPLPSPPLPWGCCPGSRVPKAEVKILREMPGRNVRWIPEERASFKREKSSRVASLEESGAATRDLSLIHI